VEADFEGNNAAVEAARMAKLRARCIGKQDTKRKRRFLIQRRTARSWRSVPGLSYAVKENAVRYVERSPNRESLRVREVRL
jgi:hypothetical protein